MTGRRCKKLLFATIFVVFAGAAVAQSPENTPQNAPQPPRSGDTRGPTVAAVADAPNARLAALVRRDVTLVRSKGVAAVARRAVGVYCITPNAVSGIVPTTAIVLLTPEYYYSALNEIKVQWASQGSGCGSNRIGVYTLADPTATGLYQFSNAVSFSIVVP